MTPKQQQEYPECESTLTATGGTEFIRTTPVGASQPQYDGHEAQWGRQEDEALAMDVRALLREGR